MRIGLVVMTAIGLIAVGLRVVEFTTLNIRWDANAYGSALWVLIGLHTTHLVGDVAETVVFLVMIFAGPLDARRFSDVEDNQAYWDFVVLAWLPVYFTMYWAGHDAPRCRAFACLVRPDRRRRCVVRRP